MDEKNISHSINYLRDTIIGRGESYGDYKTAALEYSMTRGGDFSAYAADMIKVKLVRIGKNPAHADSWLDIAGYAILQYHTLKNGDKQDG